MFGEVAHRESPGVCCCCRMSGIERTGPAGGVALPIEARFGEDAVREFLPST